MPLFIKPNEEKILAEHISMSLEFLPPYLRIFEPIKNE